MSNQNPFIAEVCDHYPTPTPQQKFHKAIVGLPANTSCGCADCFYCDNDGHESRESA